MKTNTKTERKFKQGQRVVSLHGLRATVYGYNKHGKVLLTTQPGSNTYQAFMPESALSRA